MDRRFATALACSLALHVLLVASFRVGGSSAQKAEGRSPLLVYLQPTATGPNQPDVGRAASPTQPELTAQTHTNALLPEIRAEERYLLSSEVDVRAQPVRMPVLIYPEKAIQMRVSGLVRLKVYISTSGKIDSVDVVETRPPSVFEEAALKALLGTEFTPAQKNGHAVKSQKLIEINFDPYENINLP